MTMRPDAVPAHLVYFLDVLAMAETTRRMARVAHVLAERTGDPDTIRLSTEFARRVWRASHAASGLTCPNPNGRIRRRGRADGEPGLPLPRRDRDGGDRAHADRAPHDRHGYPSGAHDGPASSLRCGDGERRRADS